MIRQWEEFPVGQSGNGDDLRVTLSVKGEIMIGVAAFERMGRPEWVVLLFDRKSGVIGIVPSDALAVNAFRLVEKTGMRHRLLRANIFCRHYGIRVGRTVRFGGAQIDDEGVLQLDLKRMVGVGKMMSRRVEEFGS